MSTEEKIKLYRDAKRAFDALSPMVDGPHNLEVNNPRLRDACMDAIVYLVRLIPQLEAEVGTDNL